MTVRPPVPVWFFFSPSNDGALVLGIGGGVGQEGVGGIPYSKCFVFIRRRAPLAMLRYFSVSSQAHVSKVFVCMCGFGGLGLRGAPGDFHLGTNAEKGRVGFIL